MNEKTVYVGISNKSEVRRELLESSKDIVGILKNYDKLYSVRAEKIEKIMELKNVLSELKQINNLLREKLPSEKSGEKTTIKRKMTIRTEKTRQIKTSLVKKPSSEIKKLEEELGEIEERLSKMGA